VHVNSHLTATSITSPARNASRPRSTKSTLRRGAHRSPLRLNGPGKSNKVSLPYNFTGRNNFPDVTLPGRLDCRVSSWAPSASAAIRVLPSASFPPHPTSSSVGAGPKTHISQSRLGNSHWFSGRGSVGVFVTSRPPICCTNVMLTALPYSLMIRGGFHGLLNRPVRSFLFSILPYTCQPLSSSAAFCGEEPVSFGFNPSKATQNQHHQSTTHSARPAPESRSVPWLSMCQGPRSGNIPALLRYDLPRILLQRTSVVSCLPSIR
jgi:hypothetical protein